MIRERLVHGYVRILPNDMILALRTRLAFVVMTVTITVPKPVAQGAKQFSSLGMTSALPCGVQMPLTGATQTLQACAVCNCHLRTRL